MPRGPEQNEQIRGERQMCILQAALTVYVERGYAGTEMDDIAHAAGLAHGLVYYYFKNKQTLFQALFAWMGEKSLLTARECLLDETLTPLARLRRYARRLSETRTSDPHLVGFFLRAHQDFALIYQEAKEIPMARMHERFAMLVTVMEAGMDAGEIRRGDAELAAQAYWGALTAMLRVFSHRQPSPADAPALIEEILDYSLSGVLNHIP